MKKIVYWVMATVTGLVLLFSYRTSLGDDLSTAGGSAAGGTDAGDQAGAPASPSSGTGSSGASNATGASASPSQQTTSSSGLADGTYTGSTASTRYGGVQVQIVVSGGRLVDATVPQYPTASRRDQQINSVAIPELVSETIDAQSANISMITGATYTSRGYRQSLQSALDQAQR